MHILEENHWGGGSEESLNINLTFLVWYCEKYNREFYRYLLCQAFRAIFINIQTENLYEFLIENFKSGLVEFFIENFKLHFPILSVTLKSSKKNYIDIERMDVILLIRHNKTFFHSSPPPSLHNVPKELSLISHICSLTGK